jgi:ubiquitin C-terminal hydrolase
MMAFLRGNQEKLNMFQWMRSLNELNAMYAPNQGQQDAQEFVSFALDLLHEEFNTVVNKVVQPKSTTVAHVL